MCRTSRPSFGAAGRTIHSGSSSYSFGQHPRVTCQGRSKCIYAPVARRPVRKRTFFTDRQCIIDRQRLEYRRQLVRLRHQLEVAPPEGRCLSPRSRAAAYRRSPERVMPWTLRRASHCQSLHLASTPFPRFIGSRSAPCSRIYSPDDQTPLLREHPCRSRSLLESHLSIPRPSGLAVSPAPPRKPPQKIKSVDFVIQWAAIVTSSAWPQPTESIAER